MSNIPPKPPAPQRKTTSTAKASNETEERIGRSETSSDARAKKSSSIPLIRHTSIKSRSLETKQKEPNQRG